MATDAIGVGTCHYDDGYVVTTYVLIIVLASTVYCCCVLTYKYVYSFFCLRNNFVYAGYICKPIIVRNLE